MNIPVVIYNLFLLLLDVLLLGIQIVAAVMETLYRTFVPAKEKELRGDVAVVTGGGHGIGLEIASQLADLGVKVAVWDINEDGAKETVRLIEKKGELGLALAVDVSNREEVRRAADITRKELGEVSLLVNNAGIMPCKPFLDFSEKEVEKIFSVNVYSQYWTIFEFLPRMLSLDRGHILSISSIAGITGTPNLVPYCSSKFAVKGLMDALFLELRSSYPDSRVKTTTIHPFVVDTGLAQKPRSRFQQIIPFTAPQSAASQIIAAMRRDEEYAFIPSILCLFTAVSRLLPRKAQLAVIDFMDCNCDPHD